MLDPPVDVRYAAASIRYRMENPLKRSRARLKPRDWIAAGLARLGTQGVDSVRVEVLARDLGISKGSFYWHFPDRSDLLEQMLSQWERGELDWLAPDQDGDEGAASRWARLVNRTANPRRMQIELALREWARRDERVARRLALVEGRKAAFIAGVLREVGFQGSSAESWSEVVLLVSLGWLDRATRDPEFQLANRGLGDFLSELVLAASGRPPTG